MPESPLFEAPYRPESPLFEAPYGLESPLFEALNSPESPLFEAPIRAEIRWPRANSALPLYVQYVLTLLFKT